MRGRPEEISSLGQLSELVLNATDVDPANAVFISPEDTLYLVVWPSVGSVTITTNLRILTPEGAISIGRYDYVTAGTRSPQVQILPLGQGQVLSVVINAFAANTLRRGQCYVALMFLRGSITSTTQFTQVLCAGYVTSLTPLFYPLGKVDGSMDGVGNLRRIAGTSPGAGVDISETVPTGAMWELVAFTANLVTSATVASRAPILVFDDGTTLFANVRFGVLMPASSNNTCTWAPTFPYDATFPGFSSAPLPPGLILPPGYRIRTVTGNLQASDQWGAPSYLVQEWLQT
jgi:hypothetical protein